MDKHYFYYFYIHSKGFGFGICCSETPIFPLCDSVKYIRKGTDGSATISFWKEISCGEYEEMSKILNNTQQ